MAVGSFIAGRFTGTYDPPGAVVAADWGLTRKGYKISVKHKAQVIEESDGFGAMAIEAIHRGLSDCILSADFLEWKAVLLTAAFPFGAAIPVTGAGYLGPGVIGRLVTDVSGILLLSSVAGTPAAAQPASLSALYCSIKEDFPVEFVLNSELRNFDLQFRIWPYVDTGVTKLIVFT